MIIDFHTHLFPEKIAASTIAQLEGRSGLKASCNGTREGLLDSMERAGIELSVVLPVVTIPRQFDSVNRFAQETNHLYGEHLISFGGIHPDSPDYKEELRTLKGMGFRGIKLHPDYQGFFFHDIRYKRIVSYATELGMVIAVHTGVDIGLPNVVHCTPAMAKEVLLETEADKLVLAHYGGWRMWDEVEELLLGTKCYLDTSFIYNYIEKEQFLRVLNGHGAKRILFATDCPWSDQSKAVEWIRQLGLSEEVMEAVFCGNAKRLLQIDHV